MAGVRVRSVVLYGSEMAGVRSVVLMVSDGSVRSVVLYGSEMASGRCQECCSLW